MKLIYRMLTLLGLMTLAACVHETPSPDSPPEPEKCLVSLTVSKEAVTKSILPSDIENRLENAFVLIMGSGGYFRYQYFDFTSASPSSSVDWLLPSRMDYTIYAVGNMGNIFASIPQTEEGPDMEAFRFEVPPYSSLTAMPMAKLISLPASQLSASSGVSLSITLERLMAKVNIRIDKSGITGGETAPVLQSASLHLRQVAKALYPFRADGSRALTDADVFSGDTDYYVFPAAEAWSRESGEITLYVPENRQGQLLGANDVQALKSEKNADIAALSQKNRLTYVEYASAKDGSTDGVSGGLTYRGYLGSNETNDFSVERNRTYSATLSLTWDGFTWQADGWRIEHGSDWNDARRLTFLDAEGHALSYLKIHKKGSGDAYAYFAVDGDDSSGTAGRKDLSSYPYGWYLTGNNHRLSGHDGSTDQYTVAEGVSVQCLGAATAGGKAVTHLRFAASAAAAVTTESAQLRHRFGLHTMDGALHSTDLELDVEELPFEYDWVNSGEPVHIAQQGILRCIDPYTGSLSSEGVFHIKSGYEDKIRLSDNGDGTATVSVTGPFERLADALCITDADGDRDCPIGLEGRVPYFNCTRPSSTPIYVDGSMDLKYTYYAASEDGSMLASSLLKVSDETDLVKCGEYLDAALVEELIAPVTTSAKGKLGFRNTLASDGSIFISTYIHTYQGLNPGTGASFAVDDARIAMKGYDSAQGSHYRAPVILDFSAFNPWRFVGTPVQGGTMNDYTLYHEPRGWQNQGGIGWEPSPTYKPTETQSHSLSVGNAVVANLENLRFNAGFSDGGGYLGHKVFTGTPNKVNSDYSPTSHYSLYFQVATLADYDWETIGNYLYYEMGHYISSGWSKTEVDKAIRETGGVVTITSGAASEAEAWSYAPSGVTSVNPQAIRGVTFYVRENVSFSSWTLHYSMAQLEEGDIISHNAGKALVMLQVINPHNADSPALEKVVAEAYVRLHLYVWPAVFDVLPWHGSFVVPSTGLTVTDGWVYEAYPFAFTEGKSIHGLETAEYGNFFSKAVLKPKDETYTQLSTTDLISNAASQGTIARDILIRSGMAVWRFKNENAFSTGDTEEQRRSRLMEALSGIHTQNSPFIFKSNSGNDNLSTVLGAGTFYRKDDVTLYYDPSGSKRVYSLGSNAEDQLFVIHIGGGEILKSAYYFDTLNGFQ